MRSRTSRGVPEWSGGKYLYMGSPVLVTGKVSGFIGNVPGPPGGSRGPPSGATSPGGLHGPSVGGDQPQVGWCAPHQGPRRKGEWEGANPRSRWALRPTLGAPPSLPLWPPPRWDLGAAAAPREGTLGGGAAPPLPLYILEVLGLPYRRFDLSLGATLPLFLLISRGAWRSPAGSPRSSTTTTPLCCCRMESSSTSPSLLAGSRHGRRHRAVRVLNAEVPSIRH